MSVVVYVSCDHGDKHSTCARRTLPFPDGQRMKARLAWEAEGWVETADGRHLCPMHSGRGF